ncbi:MAG: DUF3160 domain-containing protein [Sedimentisphaerales bacterium]|nr:DUF3160 domain-containing protein [Sedimentisphaerales bacterium]
MYCNVGNAGSTTGKGLLRLVVWGLLVSRAAATTNELYVVDESGVLGTVDVPSGTVTVIGDTGLILTDIAFDPQGKLFGLSLDVLYEIDSATGEPNYIGLHGVPQANALVAGADGTLYAAGSGGTWLYTVDPNSARATPWRDIGFYAWGDMAFLDGALYLTAQGNDLVRLDLADGGPARLVGSFGPLNLYGLDTLDGTLYGTAGTSLYAIDPNTGAATEVCDYAGQGLAAAWGATAPPPGPKSDLPPRPGFARYYEPCEPNVVPNAPGYTLPLDVNDITNFAQVDEIIDLDGVAELIRQNGFAVIEPNAALQAAWGADDDIIEPYNYLRARGVPLFFTTDTMLHLYHVQFDETLREIEERWFVGDINDLTVALLGDALRLYGQLQGDLQEAAKRNVAYLSVARMLMDPNASVSTFVVDEVAGELAKIEAHEGFVPSDIFIYDEDYSQYVPRGHYTRSAALQRYFKTMMWYGRMAFLLKGADP